MLLLVLQEFSDEVAVLLTCEAGDIAEVYEGLEAVLLAAVVERLRLDVV